MSSAHKPSITPLQDGPLMVKGLSHFSSQKGAIAANEKMTLCRCGQSAHKPFCDGTHAKIGFSSAKLEGRSKDRRDNYAGKQITVHDNRSLCAHAGYCTERLASVFHLKDRPWIQPDNASTEEIIKAINKCPSGALSYTIEGAGDRDQNGEPMIFVAPNGPYVVKGGCELLDTAMGEGAAQDHYTLCRCGGSKNKPFCDGSHWHNNFTDDKN